MCLSRARTFQHIRPEKDLLTANARKQSPIVFSQTKWPTKSSRRSGAEGRELKELGCSGGGLEPQPSGPNLLQLLHCKLSNMLPCKSCERCFMKAVISQTHTSQLHNTKRFNVVTQFISRNRKQAQQKELVADVGGLLCFANRDNVQSWSATDV